jgi:glutathionylspermidine synthase
MRRQGMKERADWRARAEEAGFTFHSGENGERYWDESAAYAFSLKQIEEDLEAPVAELESMCLAFVDQAVKNEETLRRLAIPEFAWPLIAESWRRGDRNLYGRFDLAYDGSGPAKLLEYNGDTPTALFESAVFQWSWLEEGIASGALPEGADQFNSVHDKLVAALGQMRRGDTYRLHLACDIDSDEDRGTIAYLAECAKQAGQTAHCMAMADIGIAASGQFLDENDEPILTLFKLYPWEWMLKEEFGQKIGGSSTVFIEPVWKALLSTKGLLPFLWQMAPDHPNLLKAYFEDDPRASELSGARVRKPILSREGANVTVFDGARETRTDGPYGAEGYIVQDYARTFRSGSTQAIIGAWAVASEPAGICVREQESPIINNMARFVPHFIEP